MRGPNQLEMHSLGRQAPRLGFAPVNPNVVYVATIPMKATSMTDDNTGALSLLPLAPQLLTSWKRVRIHHRALVDGVGSVSPLKGIIPFGLLLFIGPFSKPASIRCPCICNIPGILNNLGTIRALVGPYYAIWKLKFDNAWRRARKWLLQGILMKTLQGDTSMIFC